MSVAAVESRQLGKKYFCPMCEGVHERHAGQLSEMRNGAGAQSSFS